MSEIGKTMGIKNCNWTGSYHSRERRGRPSKFSERTAKAVVIVRKVSVQPVIFQLLGFFSCLQKRSSINVINSRGFFQVHFLKWCVLAAIGNGFITGCCGCGCNCDCPQRVFT